MGRTKNNSINISIQKTVQEMQGFYISCIEEVAWRCGYITTEQLHALGEDLKMTDYGKYILSLSEEAL